MVFTLESELKRLLPTGLAADGVTFEQWLIWQAKLFSSDRKQPFPFTAELSSRPRSN